MIPAAATQPGVLPGVGELPAGRIRGVRDRILPPRPATALLTTAYSLMHTAAEDVAVSHVNADDAAGLITGTLLASFTPPAERHEPGMTRTRASESTIRSA